MEPAFMPSVFTYKETGEYCEQRWLEWKKIINDDPQAGLNLYNRRNETCEHKLTYLHYVCEFGNYDEFVKVAQPLSTKQKLTLFKQQDIAQYTPLMCLIMNNPIRRSSAIVKSLQLFFSELSHDEKLELLLMEECQGWNALAYAAFYNCVAAIEFLLNSIKFDPQQQLKLMKFSWRYESDTTSLGEESGYGSDEETGVKKPVSAAEVAQVNGGKESTELLERLKVEAMIQVAVETKCPDMRKKRVDEVSYYESMTLEQIEELSSQIGDYVQPQNQTKSRKYGLVCYATDNREGADTEAKKMKDSLEMLDHEVTSIRWDNAQILEQEFKNNLERIKTTCCFLTVCVMAHGSPVAVRGSDGSILQVNRILQLVENSLPYCTPAVPVVLILQFCQTSNQNRDMARRGYPPQTGAQPPRSAQSTSGSRSSTTHIELSRPHTLLLMSTVKGGTAFRGAYTSELAYQFSP